MAKFQAMPKDPNQVDRINVLDDNDEVIGAIVRYRGMYHVSYEVRDGEFTKSKPFKDPSAAKAFALEL